MLSIMMVFNKLKMVHRRKSSDHDGRARMLRCDRRSDGAEGAESAEMDAAMGAGADSVHAYKGQIR